MLSDLGVFSSGSEVGVEVGAALVCVGSGLADGTFVATRSVDGAGVTGEVQAARNVINKIADKRERTMKTSKHFPIPKFHVK